MVLAEGVPEAYRALLCAHSQAAPPVVEALRGALLRLEASALDALTRSLFSKANAARHFGHSALDRSALPPASSSAAPPTLQSLRAEIDAAVGASAAALSAASGGGSTDASGGSGVGVRFGSSVLPFPNANFVFFTSKAAAAHLASDWTADDVLADRSAAPQPQPPRRCRCGSAAVRQCAYRLCCSSAAALQRTTKPSAQLTAVPHSQLL